MSNPSKNSKIPRKYFWVAFKKVFRKQIGNFTILLDGEKCKKKLTLLNKSKEKNMRKSLGKISLRNKHSLDGGKCK